MLNKYKREELNHRRFQLANGAYNCFDGSEERILKVIKDLEEKELSSLSSKFQTENK